MKRSSLTFAAFHYTIHLLGEQQQRQLWKNNFLANLFTSTTHLSSSQYACITFEMYPFLSTFAWFACTIVFFSLHFSAWVWVRMLFSYCSPLCVKLKASSIHFSIFLQHQNETNDIDCAYINYYLHSNVQLFFGRFKKTRKKTIEQTKPNMEFTNMKGLTLANKWHKRKCELSVCLSVCLLICLFVCVVISLSGSSKSAQKHLQAEK